MGPPQGQFRAWSQTGGGHAYAIVAASLIAVGLQAAILLYGSGSARPGWVLWAQGAVLCLSLVALAATWYVLVITVARQRADAAARLKQLDEERTAELEQRGAVLEATFQNPAQGLLMVDKDLRILVHNLRFAELWNLPPNATATYQTLPDLLRYVAERGQFAPSTPTQDVVATRLAAIGTGRPFQDEAQLSNGTILEIRGMPLLGGGSMLTYTDITERRRIEEDVRTAKDAAEAANSAKSSFLANMTHELRTPMNGVLGVLELLHQTNLDKEQRELIDVIGSSAEALLKIIDDILDLSKIEAGKMEIEHLPLAPLQLVEGVADTLASHAHRKNLSFTTYVDPSVPPAIMGDPVRLRQVLFNLIGNAIKFTEHGSVSVQLTTEGPGSVNLSVMDTGIGLDEAACARLFNPFVQADATTTRRFGGTGLGLSICRRLVELMGGSIGVDSAVGRGSTFWVRLPLEPASTSASASDGPIIDTLAGLRVLVVEDDPIASWFVTRYLASAGAAIQTAPSAEAALRQLAEPSGFDVVVLDLKLPGRDGFELHLQMMNDPRLGHVKAVLLTASNDPADRRRALAANFAACLTKPVRKATLIHAIAAAAGRASAGTVERKPLPTPSDGAADGTRGRILVAEDHQTNRMVITQQLASLGYAVDVVADGRAALATLADGQHYDLLLTDCYMPEMDGYELARALREHERVKGTARLPIVALTAATLQGEAERCFAAGMDDYLPKPIKLAQLDETLRRWIGGEAAADRPGTAAAAVQPTRPPAFDLDELREVLGTLDERTRAFMRQFVEATPPLIAQIRQAIVARDRHEAQRIGHAAKGAARSVMAAELAELFAAVEQCVDHEDWSSAEARAAELAPALQRARDFVASV